MSARVELPAAPSSRGVFSAGQPVAAQRTGAWWILDQPITGTASLEVR
jgi:hypothetical protein